MRHALKLMLTVMAFLTALHGFRAFLGPETWSNVSEFMFGDYIAVYERHGGTVWAMLVEQASREEFRPFLIAAAVLAAVSLLLRFVTVSRNVCALIAGVFLFDLGLWYFADGDQPSTRFTLYGVGSLLWMIVASFIGREEVGMGSILRRIWRRYSS